MQKSPVEMTSKKVKSVLTLILKIEECMVYLYNLVLLSDALQYSLKWEIWHEKFSRYTKRFVCKKLNPESSHFTKTCKLDFRCVYLNLLRSLVYFVTQVIKRVL